MMTPWVLRLIVANVAVYLLAEAATPAVRYSFAFVPYYVVVRPWSPVTYMFLHAGFGHILFNMLGLFFFGPRLEYRLGGRAFLALYFVSGVTGAVLSLAGALAGLTNPLVPIVGASGAVFGVFLGFARFWPRERVWIWGIFPVEARVLVVVMTALALYGGFGARGGGIAHFAHLGGFAGGWLFLRFMDWNSRAARFKRKASVPSLSSGDADRWLRIRREDLHPVNRDELDRVLAKLRDSGAASLTDEERAFLNRFAPG